MYGLSRYMICCIFSFFLFFVLFVKPAAATCWVELDVVDSNNFIMLTPIAGQDAGVSACSALVCGSVPVDIW